MYFNFIWLLCPRHGRRLSNRNGVQMSVCVHFLGEEQDPREYGGSPSQNLGLSSVVIASHSKTAFALYFEADS